MYQHGKAPRIHAVKAHARWLNGRRKRTKAYVRGMTHPLGCRAAPEQLDLFG